MSEVQFPQGTAEVKVTTKYVRIWIDKALATAIEYPFSDPTNDRVEVFNEDGKRYKTVLEFATAYELPFSAAPESTEEVPLKVESELDWTQPFTFESLEQLRRTWKQASAVAQTELKLRISGTVTVGKQRIEKAKQWLEAPLDIENMLVERVATKWIFFTDAEPQLFAKALENATFTFSID